MSDEFVLSYDTDRLLDALEKLGPPATLAEGKVRTAAVVFSALISDPSTWRVTHDADGRVHILKVSGGGGSGEVPPPPGARAQALTEGRW